MSKFPVFLAWSGARSRAVALALRTWLPQFIHNVEPWMSELDMEIGKRWSVSLQVQLRNAKAGIVCLTPENTREPWINFEAGVLSRNDSCLFTYLYAIEPKDVLGPLAEFQHTKANERGTRQLIRTLNGALGQAALDENVLLQGFNVWWLKLEADLAKITDLSQATTTRSVNEQKYSGMLNKGASRPVDVTPHGILSMADPEPPKAGRPPVPHEL